MANLKCTQSTVGEDKNVVHVANDENQMGDQLKTGVQNETKKEEHHNLKSGEGQCLITANEVMKSSLQKLEVTTSLLISLSVASRELVQNCHGKMM